MDTEIAIIEYAIELDLPELFQLCERREVVNKFACANKTFWRMKIAHTYRAIKELDHKINSRQYFMNLDSQYKKGFLPTDPQADYIANQMRIGRYYDIYRIANQAAETEKTLDSFCLQYFDCHDDEFWKNMFKIFYSHIKGDPVQYKNHYWPHISWKQLYFEVKNTPIIIHSGFY